MTTLPERIAVVGGAGFIGSHLVERLAAAGSRVLVIDDHSHPCGAPEVPGVEYLVADAGGDEAADALARFRPQALAHLAAKGGVQRALRNPREHIQRVLAHSVGCFESAVRAGAEHLVIASSGGAVYGDPATLPADEGLEPAPRSAYGAEKLSEEVYLATYRLRGVRTLALRYGNVYGPRQDGTGEAGVVAISATRICQGEAPVIYGDGSQTRDFVFVGDVAGATVAALGSDRSGFVNVGTGRETSVLQVVLGLLEVAESPLHPEFAAPRTGEVQRVCLDTARSHDWLGWTAETSLEAGLATTLEHFRSATTPLKERV